MLIRFSTDSLRLLTRYPYNWGLRITDLKPTDAGIYLCQLSTFPPKVRIVYLEIHGESLSSNFIGPKFDLKQFDWSKN